MTNRYHGHQFMNVAALIPRLWVILIAFAIPFIVVCADYFEALERTGTVGAIIADMLLPVIIIGYIAFIFILKKRRI